MKNNLAMCTQKVAHPNLQFMFKNMNDIVGYTKYCVKYTTIFIILIS